MATQEDGHWKKAVPGRDQKGFLRSQATWAVAVAVAVVMGGGSGKVFLGDEFPSPGEAQSGPRLALGPPTKYTLPVQEPISPAEDEPIGTKSDI